MFLRASDDFTYELHCSNPPEIPIYLVTGQDLDEHVCKEYLLDEDSKAHPIAMRAYSTGACDDITLFRYVHLR
jgi:hypothetical protein